MVPERHAVILCFESILRMDSHSLQEQAHGLMKQLDKKFPYSRFIISYGDKVDRKAYDIKKLLGVVDVFESIPLLDSGFVVVPDIIHGSKEEIIFSLLDAISFSNVLALLRDIDNVESDVKKLYGEQIVASVVSILAEEIDVMRDSEVNVAKEFRLLDMFVGFHFCSENESLNPLLNAFSTFDSTSEQLIIQIIGELQAVLKSCSSFFKLFKENSALKYTEAQLSSLFDRITRNHSKQEIKELKKRCEQIKEDTFAQSGQDELVCTTKCSISPN